MQGFFVMHILIFTADNRGENKKEVNLCLTELHWQYS